jgi:hypothetical protein
MDFGAKIQRFEHTKMFGEEGKITNEELEFISEETEIDIIPKTSLGKLKFITVCNHILSAFLFQKRFNMCVCVSLVIHLGNNRSN